MFCRRKKRDEKEEEKQYTREEKKFIQCVVTLTAFVMGVSISEYFQNCGGDQKKNGI